MTSKSPGAFVVVSLLLLVLTVRRSIISGKLVILVLFMLEGVVIVWIILYCIVLFVISFQLLNCKIVRAVSGVNFCSFGLTENLHKCRDRQIVALCKRSIF